MLTKEQALTLFGVLATASIIGVGFAIGGTIGEAVMGGIGINLSSNIIRGGSGKLKERWLSSNDGIRNHDIQQTLARAFIKALIDLEAEYFKLGEANALSKSEKKSIKALFKELREQAPEVFPASLEKAAKQPGVKDYLYGSPETSADKLWEHINGTNLLNTYSEHLRDFLRQNLLNEVQYWFSEELKTDNKECNKAWRAFQRLLLEGIQADVKALHASQDLIRKDLQTLDALRIQLDQLRDTIDHRLPNEPFQQSLEKAVNEMQVVVQAVARTTQRTEEKVDAIAADVKRLLPETEVEIPKVPDDVQKLFDKGWALYDLGKYEDARTIFQKSLELATNYEHKFAIAKAKYCLAVILNEWDKNAAGAKVLLQECLRGFRTANSEWYIASALYQLGVIEIDVGNLDQAEVYLSQALELDKKHEMKQGIALTLHQLGWVEDHRGHSKQALALYDQALTYFLRVYQEGNPKTEKDAILGIAGCYHHKGLIFERDGSVDKVEANYVRALDWYRKSDFKPYIAKILYLLARMKYREGQYNAGTQFLDEAINIYDDIRDHSRYARCLDLKGRLRFTLGEADEAATIFESALNAVEKSRDYKEQESYLNKLGHLYLEARKFDQAKGYFERARDLSLGEGLLDGYATSVGNLAQVAHIEKKRDERNRLLSDGIQTLEKLLLSVQAEPRRAFIIGQIGSFYEKMEKYQEALIYYQKAKKAFESLSDIGGVANSLGSIARMKGLLGKRNEEFDTYRELKKLLDGTPYYDLIAGAAINLGAIQMQIGNLDEAKTLFQEAEFYCRKYNLPFLSNLEMNKEILATELKKLKPPEFDLKELVNDLFELVNSYPESKDSLFRLWFFEKGADLCSNYRSMLGIKLMFCQDDVDSFLKAAKAFAAYSELCLQVVSSKYPDTINEQFEYPTQRGFSAIFSFAAVPKGTPKDAKLKIDFSKLKTRYIVFGGSSLYSKTTGNEGWLVWGWSVGLPEQAHQLILSSSAAELTSQKIFFLPYERYLANDKLLSDLRLSKKLGLIPVYFDSLPSSESVEVITSTTVKLPVLLPDEAEPHRKQIGKVKRSLTQLLSATKDSAQSLLSSFASEIDEMSNICANTRSVEIQIYILDFPSVLQREFNIALVVSS